MRHLCLQAEIIRFLRKPISNWNCLPWSLCQSAQGKLPFLMAFSHSFYPRGERVLSYRSTVILIFTKVRNQHDGKKDNYISHGSCRETEQGIVLCNCGAGQAALIFTDKKECSHTIQNPMSMSGNPNRMDRNQYSFFLPLTLVMRVACENQSFSSRS